MKDRDYDRIIIDAKNEIGTLVMCRLGGGARRAVAAAAEVERNIHSQCDHINKLVQDATCREG